MNKHFKTAIQHFFLGKCKNPKHKEDKEKFIKMNEAFIRSEAGMI